MDADPIKASQESTQLCSILQASRSKVANVRPSQQNAKASTGHCRCSKDTLATGLALLKPDQHNHRGLRDIHAAVDHLDVVP